MSSPTASVLNRGKPPVLIEGIASTTLTLKGASNYRLTSASGAQSVTTINLPSVRAGHEIVLIGTSDTNYVALASGGNIKVPGTRNLLNGVGVQLKFDGTNWCEIGSGIDSAGAATTLLDGLTAGTIVASKAVTVDANKDASAFRNITVTNLDAGASGTAGTVDVFPSTASRGKLQIAWVNTSSGDHTTTLTNAAQTGAFSFSLPAVSANATFIVDTGNQSISGTKFFSAAPVCNASGSAMTSDNLIFSTLGVEGLRIRRFDQTVAITGTGTDIDLAANLPAGSMVIATQMTFPTAVATATATKVGLGVAADPDKYGLSSGLTQHTKTNFMPTTLTYQTSAEDIRLFSVDNSGAAAGNFNNSGSVRVVIYFYNMVDLVN